MKERLVTDVLSGERSVVSCVLLDILLKVLVQTAGVSVYT